MSKTARIGLEDLADLAQAHALSASSAARADHLGDARFGRTVVAEPTATAFLRSEPIDGHWTTAWAEVRVDGCLFDGYATARSPSTNLQVRAMGEAVERAVWHTAAASACRQEGGQGVAHNPSAPPQVLALSLADAEFGRLPEAFLSGPSASDPSPPCERTSAGSAVHMTPAKAIAAASREVLERVAFLTGFHRRALGRRLPVGTVAPLDEERSAAFWDPATSLLTVVAEEDAPNPRLIAGASIVEGRQPTRAEVEACMAETIQPRAWLRREAAERPPVTAASQIVDPLTRGLFWIHASADLASEVLSELLVGSQSLACSPAPPAIWLIDLAHVRLGLHDLWYARCATVEAPYAVHSGPLELALAAPLANRFVPHPLV